MTAPLQLVTERSSGEMELARRAAAGDEGAFEAIYLANSGRVFALCLKMSRSRERAAELTQDVFVHVWRGIGTWRGESALSSWIHRVAVNLVLGSVRRERARAMHEDEDPEDRQQLRAPHPGASPGDRVDLERAIASLPPGARNVFVLHDVEGFQHAEIARMTGTAEGTCRAQLHRARRLLMEALER